MLVEMVVTYIAISTLYKHVHFLQIDCRFSHHKLLASDDALATAAAALLGTG